MTDMPPLLDPEIQRRINEIGGRSGCNHCGTKDPSTRSGNFVADCHPVPALQGTGEPRLYPACLACGCSQGGYVAELLRRRYVDTRSKVLAAPRGAMRTVRIQPSNSIVFVEDASGASVPTADRPDPIMANAGCVSACTSMESDGETAITLGHLEAVRLDRPPGFDGVIVTPTGTVAVSVVDTSIALEDRSGSPRTRIVIWTNRVREPDKIVIGFERA